MLFDRYNMPVLLCLVALGAFQAVAQISPHSASPAFLLDTALCISDIDADGLSDWWETRYFGGPTNAMSADVASGDGLTNLEKYNGGWNPWIPVPRRLPHGLTALFTLDMADRAPDTDGDGIPDWWEILYFGGPTNAAADSVAAADGLSNIEKYNGGWDPWSPVLPALLRAVSAGMTVDTGGWPGGYDLDSDEDGMPDWWEVKYGLDPDRNDANEDLDGDGIPNLTEYLLGMIPNVDDLSGEAWDWTVLFRLDTAGRALDTDGDGLPDWWEVLYFGGPTAADADAVMTEDGLTNLEKYNAGWNPWVSIIAARSRSASMNLLTDTGGWPGGYSLDSDDDGMPDWWEVKHGLNRFMDDADDDPDDDGRSNLEEYLAGTNPRVFDWFVIFEVAQGNIFLLDTGGRFADEDGDGIPNWWERRYTGSNAGMNAYALAAGGMTYLEKYIAYLDPTDPAALFVIGDIEAEQSPDESQVTIRWPTSSGRLYKLFTVNNLSSPWPDTAEYQVEGDGTIKGCTITIEDSHPRFFKITVELLPRP